METPLTQNISAGREPFGIREYERAGGYQALRKALRDLTPAQVQEEVKASNLRGRGGAGFPTGLKWSFSPVGDQAARPKYLVANADEMEPGTFKDRLLMEGDPHQLIEGIVLASYATDVDIAYIFIRGEYRTAAQRLSKAIIEARESNCLGRNILGSGYSLEMYVHSSAGRYMCGEETGMLNALEGKRANPRTKPPFPGVSGLFGKPTIVNNVETLCNVPHIVNRGAAWFRNLGLTRDGGTKIFGVSGKVKRPGLWELPMGTTVREILEEHAGGMRDGVRFRGLLPGGASTDFLVEEHLDVRMDFTEPQKAGSRMGTGTMIVLDDKTCPVGMLWNLEHFFAQESCGWCTPCWSGLAWVERILQAMEEGRGQPGDIEKLTFQTKFFGPGHTFCALAPGAAEPLQSGVKYFRDDFERHIREKRCPWAAGAV
ncbi:MAG: NADH-quinone oxidoreductase subunit NuoF [Bryobacteraceae bacterium]|nr:NADH-quinone oxidoreductase subunit NuoF [Bryobacterales bacterium]NUN00859.1 NADH-quinone oxidoreductase subunit NuoF [Bryobacteraceae bacterium]